MDKIDEIKTGLQTAAHRDPVFSAVSLMFSQRKRTRRQVTVGALAQRMHKEGFEFKPSDYARVLKTLSGLGIGHLKLSPKGRIKALTDISVTLQSVGNL